MSALREIFARFRTSFDDKALKKGAHSTDSLIDRLSALKEEIAGAALVWGVRHFAQEMTHAAMEVDLTRQRLGLSSEQVQAWGLAARMAGRDAEDFVDAISTLQERARDAIIDPKSDPAQQLRLLGVEARDASGALKDGQTLILEVADAMSAMESDTDRVGAAMTLFGDVGRELLPILRQGRAGFEGYEATLRELGGGISEDAIAASREMAMASARLDLAMLSLKSKLSVLLLPALSRSAEASAKFAGALARLAQHGRLMEVTMAALGVAAVTAGRATLLTWLRAAASFLALAAVVAAAILIFEDLTVAMEGGDSVIGDFADSVVALGRVSLGDGSVLGGIIGAWEYLASLINAAVDGIMSVLGFDPLPARHDIERDAQTPQEAALARQMHDQNQEGMGWVSNLFPQDFQNAYALSHAHQFLQNATPEERARRVREAEQYNAGSRGQIVAGPRVQNVTVNAHTNASPAEIRRAVVDALDEQNAEAVDALGQGAEG